MRRLSYILAKYTKATELAIEETKANIVIEPTSKRSLDGQSLICIRTPEPVGADFSAFWRVYYRISGERDPLEVLGNPYLSDRAYEEAILELLASNYNVRNL